MTTLAAQGKSLPDFSSTTQYSFVQALSEMYSDPGLYGLVLRTLIYYVGHPLSPPRPADIELLLALSIVATRADQKARP
jgi:hypothetical protein